jgi:hypothetical protein
LNYLLKYNKFIAGIGLPVDIDPESMTIGYVFKAQYFLPFNVTQLYPTRLARDLNVDESHHEVSHDEETKVKSDVGLPDTRTTDAIDIEGVRWSIYHALDMLLRDKMKIDGRQCILRAICEASKHPFSFESGLLGELLHILFV